MDFGGSAGGAASSAADAISSANLQAIQAEMAAVAQARQDIAPWREAGQTALNQYGGLLGLQGFRAQDPTATLQSTPGYQWQLQQGVNALDRSAASRGLLTSGAQQKGLLNYGQNLGYTMAWQPYFSALGNMQGQGQNAAAMQGQTSMQGANQIANLYQNSGQAQAQGILAGYQGQQAGMAGGIGNLFGLAGLGLGMYGAGLFS